MYGTSQPRLLLDEIATLFDPLPHRLDYAVALVYYYYCYLINTQSLWTYPFHETGEKKIINNVTIFRYYKN